MPLIGKRLYEPCSPPKDLKSEEEVFVIKETNEVFRSYDEYVNRIILYGFQVWTCHLTGKTNLKYGEAVASEQQALQRLEESFPKYFEKPVLQLVHHSTSGLQSLAQQCSKQLEGGFVEDEPVKCYINEKWLQGRISRVHFSSNAELVSKDILSSSSSPSSDKENSVREEVTSPSAVSTVKAVEAKYDVMCENTEKCYLNIPPGDIKRVKTLPSAELLQCFIRANTENSWKIDGSPWLVKNELVKKYSLPDKFNDFSLVLSKKTTPSSKLSSKPGKSSEKPKKKPLDDSTSHSKSKMKKNDPSQMKLDSFGKLSHKANSKHTTTPSKSGSVKGASSSKKNSEEMPSELASSSEDDFKACDKSGKEDDGRTPCGKLVGTPVKCKLVLTPVKSPRIGKNKKAALEKYARFLESTVNVDDPDCIISVENHKMSPKTSKTKEAGKVKGKCSVAPSASRKPISSKKNSGKHPFKVNSSIKDIVDISDDEGKDVGTTVSGKRQRTPVKSVTSPKGSSAKKAVPGSVECSKAKKRISNIGDIESVENQGKSPKNNKTKKAGDNKKKQAENSATKKLDMHVLDSDVKRSKSDVQRKNVSIDKKQTASGERNQSSDKLEVQLVPFNTKQSTGKMKQTTLLDLTKKSEEENTLSSPLKLKTKKQKTLSEMFGAAFQKDKPQTLNTSIKETTAQDLSSPQAGSLNLSTSQQDHDAFQWNKIRELHKWKLQQHLNSDKTQKSHKKVLDFTLNLKPLPSPKPVDIPSEMDAESFGDVAMIAEFVHIFRDLLLPRNGFRVTAESLIQALVSDGEGFSVLSRILVIFLEILLQDRSTKGIELGMQLSEMPLTQETASEVTRLYLNSKSNILTPDDGEELQETVLSLQQKEFHSLPAVEKLKVLVALCHKVMSAGAMDYFMNSQLTTARELRKQKMAKQKAKNDKIREEKEQKKKELEELMKQKEEEKQLKIDELTKTSDSGSKLETPVAENTSSGTLSKVVDTKQDKQGKENGRTEQKEGVAEVKKALRSQGPLKDENVEDEGRKSRLEKEEEEQWNIDMAHCQYSLRLKPLGYDRHHARYWVFAGGLAGVYVEQGWNEFQGIDGKDNSQCVEADGSEQKEVSREEGETEETGNGRHDVEMEVEATKGDDNPAICSEKDGHLNKSVTEVPYKWCCYDTVEDIKVLLTCLSCHGKQEKALLKSLRERMEAITAGINKRSSSTKSTVQEKNELQLLSSLKEELSSMAESLVNGNLAVLACSVEEYQEAVEQASTVSDLASQLEKLLPAVLPQFLQGIFAKDKKGSESAKQQWVDEVKTAATLSRIHLLLAILDSTVIWDLSAENKPCKVCHRKGLGTTLILCDDCNLAFHLQCLRPALSEVPEGHWSCPVCKPNERQEGRTGMKNYKEMCSSDTDDEEEEEYEESEEQSEEESDGHEDYCNTCGEDGDLICCDICPLVFHKDCHQPPLRNIPRGPWSCWMCRQPQNKKQKQNTKGSKKAKKKVETRATRGKRTTNRSKPRRSPSTSSEESGPCRKRQPIESSPDDVSPRDRRRRARACIEEFSESSEFTSKSRRKNSADSSEESGARKTRQRGGKQSDLKNVVGRKLRKCRQEYNEVEEVVEREAGESNVKSFYGRLRKRGGQTAKVHEEIDDESSVESSPDPPARRSRAAKRQISILSDDSEDEESEAENPEYSRRNGVKAAKTRQIPSSSDESDCEDEEDSPTAKNAKTSAKRSKVTVSSAEETEDSEHNASMEKTTVKKRASKNRAQEASKSKKRSATNKTRRSRQDEENTDEEAEDEAIDTKTTEGRGRGNTLKRSASSGKQQNGSRVTRGNNKTLEDAKDVKDKRRRANLDLDVCDQILRDLLLHDDSWPFRQAVNLREVPDYLTFVATPMDLGTIKEKLQNLEYPDVESFVADLRLVFSNCDKYNVTSSDVGQAGINLQTYFESLFKQHFPSLDKKVKVQRKR